MIATPSQLQSHPSIIGSPFVKSDAVPNDRRLGDNSLPNETLHPSELIAAELFEGEDLSRVGYLPTPEDIASACASIRSEWTLSEKRRRYVGDFMPDEPESVWRPPVIDTTHFRISAGQATTESCF